MIITKRLAAGNPAPAPRRPARIVDAPAAPAAAVQAPALNARMAAALQRTGIKPAVEESAGEDNRRWAKRKSRNALGGIVFPGTTVPFSCTVLDISSTGARLEMMPDRYNAKASTESLPNEFVLLVTLDRIEVDCQSMWRRGSRVGVKFLGAVRPIRVLQAPPPPARRGCKI